MMRVTPEIKPRYNLEEIKSNMLKTGVGNMNLRRIMDVIQRASGEPEDIGPVFTYFDKRKESFIEVTVSSNGREAEIEVTDWNKLEITPDDLRFCLYKAGVVAGIDEEKLRQVVRRRPVEIATVVARAVEPVNGKDAKIEQLVKVMHKPRPKILPDGSVDLKSYDMLVPVEKDEVLLRKIPATKGTAGSTVDGRVIPPTPGKDAGLSKGKGTYLSEDGLELRAAISGSVMMDKRGRLYVEKTYVVHGNLGYSTGNVDTAGDVKVKGDVLAGFSVETDGDIIVHGIVEGARIVSRHGSVMVKGGIHGHQKQAHIEAEETVAARFIQQAVVTAGDTVMVSEHVLDSIISAGNKVDVSSKNGHILNSEIQAGKEIIVRNMGSTRSNKTKAHIGDPHRSVKNITQQIKELDKAIAKKASEIDRYEHDIQALVGSSKYRREDELKVKNYVTIMVNLYKQQRAAEAKRAELRKKLSALHQGRITVIDIIYAGCVVSIGDISSTVTESVKGVVFSIEDGEIVAKAIDEAED